MRSRQSGIFYMNSGDFYRSVTFQSINMTMCDRGILHHMRHEITTFIWPEPNSEPAVTGLRLFTHIQERFQNRNFLVVCRPCQKRNNG